MGSLFKTSTPRYTPAPYKPSVTVPAPTPISVQEKTDSVDKAQNAIRRVARNRGVGSTILTSFRGVLDDKSSLAPQRKNLLGE
jgi:hypothetical protein